MVFAFHTCTFCGQPIKWERLQVFPETRRCVLCSEKYGTDIDMVQTTIGMDPDTYKDLLGAVRS